MAYEIEFITDARFKGETKKLNGGWNDTRKWFKTGKRIYFK